MAFQTSAGILQRFQTVLEASPCSLTASPNPFTVEQVANAVIDTTYRVRSGGVVTDTEMSNYAVARVERFEVVVQRALAFDGYDAIETLQNLCDTIERAIYADGLSNSYHARLEKGSRKASRMKDADIAEAVLNFLVDYDYNQTT